MGTVKTTRAIIWLLGLFISGIVVVVPPGYFYVSYSYTAGNLASEAEINADMISRHISRNPALWEFEHVRIEEYLSRRPTRGDAETRRVFNIKNDLIAQSANGLRPPITTRSSPLKDSGVVVGRIEISRSLRPLLEQTGQVALVVTLLGLGVYLVLRVLLLGSLNRAQTLVEQNEARYGAVVEDIPMLLCRFLSDGTISFVNKAFCQYFGKTADQLLGEIFHLPAPEEERSLVPAQLGSLTADNPVAAYELRVISGNGETRWQRWIVRAICRQGRPTEFQAIGEDITEQRNAAEALRESETRFRTLFDNMMEGVALHEIVYDEQAKAVDYRIISTNPAFENQTGLKSEQILGQLATKAYGVHNAPYLERYALVAGSGRSETFETYFPSLKRHYRISVTSPKPGCFTTVFENITESKRAEEALTQSLRELHETAQRLEQSRNMLQLVVESIPVRVFWKDKDSRYLGCNTLFARDAGLSRPEELLGLDDFAMGWREQAEIYRAADRKVMDSGLPTMNIIEPQTTPAGAGIWLNTSKVPLRMPNGEIFGVLGAYEDITERKQTEEALQKTSSELQLIFKNMINAFIVWESVFDENGKYVSFRFGRFNDAYARIAKLKYEDVRGKDVFEVWPATEKSWVAVYGTVAVSGIPRTFDMFHEPTKGWYHCNAYRAGDSPSEIQVIFEDITERRQQEEERRKLEERLHRAEKMEALGTMAGGVAHDLNNVLGIVVGYSELLLDDVEDESNSLKSHVKEILKSGERAAAIVQDLLTLTRRGVTNRKVLNLNGIIMDCKESPEFTRILSYQPNTRIKVDLDVNLLNISGSSVHIVKTLMNLIANAVEAMTNGGFLTIKTRNEYLDKPIYGYDEVKDGDYVVLTVSDTGDGISDTDMKRIFEPFYTKKVMGRSGTGLGLAVVWGTVKDHLGYINVESQEGKGTTFSLYFPVTRDEVASEQISVSASEYIGNGESILIVDDVKEQRELATMMLTKLKYNVVSVPGGEEAVKYMEEHSSDLIVLDMIMDPGIDGLDTYRRILEIHPKQKAIIVSGFAENERVSQAQALGAGAYVKKPYVLMKLGLAVRNELDRPA